MSLPQIPALSQDIYKNFEKGHNSGSPKLELGKYVPDAQNNAHWDHM